MKAFLVVIPGAVNGEQYRGFDTVPPQRVHDAALRDESKFLLDLYRESEEKSEQRYQDAMNLADAMAAMVLFAVTNAAIGYLGSTGQTMMSGFISWSDMYGQMLILLTLLVLVPLIARIWLSLPEDRIYHPELAKADRNS